MGDWRFIETEEDGDLWLRNPTELHAVIDFPALSDKRRHRVMVVTTSWLDRELTAVGGSGYVVFSAMLVVPNGSPNQLKSFVDAAVARGGLEHFVPPETE